jgi:hypothetical protein
VRLTYRGPKCVIEGYHWGYYGVAETYWYFPTNAVIYVRHDDGIRVWVDGELKIDAWNPTAPKPDYYNVTVPEGLHRITIHWYDMCNGGVLQVVVVTPPTSERSTFELNPPGCWHWPRELDDDWLWMKVTPAGGELANVIPSLDLSAFPFFGANWTYWIAVMTNGGIYLKDVCNEPDTRLLDYTPSWSEFLSRAGIYPFFSDLDSNAETNVYAGWHGGHVEKWTQYGYSHSQRWATIWWDETFYKYLNNDPWFRARFGVTLYESGDMLFQYDRADFVPPGNNWTWRYTGTNWFFAGITRGDQKSWSAILSTAKWDQNSQQVGFFADVWSGLDFFDSPRPPETPDTLLTEVNTTIGNVSVSACKAFESVLPDFTCSRDYKSFAFTPSKDVLFQYQGNLFTVIGSPECINCNAPAIQPPPSPQPAEAAQTPPDCYCVCSMQSQPTTVTGNVTASKIGLVMVACDMNLYVAGG